MPPNEPPEKPVVFPPPPRFFGESAGTIVQMLEKWREYVDGRTLYGIPYARHWLPMGFGPVGNFSLKPGCVREWQRLLDIMRARVNFDAKNAMKNDEAPEERYLKTARKAFLAGTTKLSQLMEIRADSCEQVLELLRETRALGIQLERLTRQSRKFRGEKAKAKRPKAIRFEPAQKKTPPPKKGEGDDWKDFGPMPI